MDEKVKVIMAMQDELDQRTEVEEEAEKLIAGGRFREAAKLLAGMDAETPAGGAAGLERR